MLFELPDEKNGTVVYSMFKWKNLINKESESEKKLYKNNEIEEHKSTTRLTLFKDNKFELHDWKDYSFMGIYDGNIVKSQTFTGTFTNQDDNYTFSVNNWNSQRHS